MRDVIVGAEAFGLSSSRILDYRFETRRGWLGMQVVCTIVTVEREFRGSGRTQEVAVQDAIEAWERYFLLKEDADPGAASALSPAVRYAARRDALDASTVSDSFEEAGYMSSQVFSARRSAVRFAPNSR